MPCSVHRASVVDEHIQLWIAGQYLCGQSAHRGLRREVGYECRDRCSPPGRRPDASRRNARPRLAATDDGEVRAECGKRLCRRQPNAIGGTRDQDLLVVHGTAIQCYGDARVTCPMVKDLTIDHGVSDLEIKRERLFAAMTREESDASLARAGAQGRYLPAHRHACHQAFARKGCKSLIDRAEVTAARAKIRLLQDGRRFEMTKPMARPLHAMRGSL